MEFTCPDCGARMVAVDLAGWAQYGTVPANCLSCGSVLWLGVASEDQVLVIKDDPKHHGDRFGSPQPENPVTESLPEIPVGTPVRIENRNHVLHGRHGVIIAKKHVHYRVDFGDLRVLVPEQWVRYAG